MAPPKLLYVINGFAPGGAEHGLLNLLEHRAFGRWQVEIIALCQGDAQLAARAAARAPITYITQTEHLTARGMLHGWRYLRQRCQQHPPTLVVASLKQANLVARLACWRARTRLVTFEHSPSLGSKWYSALVYAPLLWLTSWRVEGIWSDSTATLRAMQRYYVPKARQTHVLPLLMLKAAPIPPRPNLPASPSPMPTSAPPTHHFALIAAGRLIPSKRYDLLLHALRHVQFPYQLTLYGTGPEQARLQAYATQHQLAVTFAGHHPNWYTHLQQADAFVHPSRVEGLCLTVLEAMSRGLPILACPVGEIAHYGQDKQNMLHIPTHATALDWAKHMDLLYRNQILRQHLAHNAPNVIQGRFTERVFRSRWHHALKEAAA